MIRREGGGKKHTKQTQKREIFTGKMDLKGRKKDL